MVPLSTSLSLLFWGKGLCGRFCFGRPFTLRDIVIIDVTLDAHQMLASWIVDREIVSVLVFVNDGLLCLTREMLETVGCYCWWYFVFVITSLITLSSLL